MGGGNFFFDEAGIVCVEDDRTILVFRDRVGTVGGRAYKTWGGGGS